MNFDFDYWADLAKKNPEEFENQKKAYLLKELEAYKGGNIEGLKTLVDSLCTSVAGTPEERMMSAQNMMLEGYSVLLSKLNELTKELSVSGSTELSAVDLYTRTNLQKK